MGRINDTISTANSTARTVLFTVVLGALGFAGYKIYDRVDGGNRELASTKQELQAFQTKLVEAETMIGGLKDDIAGKTIEINRLEVAMRLLKTDQRLASLEVLEQITNAETGKTTTKLAFTELSPDGDVIGKPMEFEVAGDIVYLDNWVVKFEDKYVEQADLARGTSLALFRRIFGEDQSPSEGFVIDEVGAMPQAYSRGGEPSPFEQEIIKDFWMFANNPEAAKEKGIRAIHGEAPSMKVEPGRRYRVVLRTSGGLSIVAEPKNP